MNAYTCGDILWTEYEKHHLTATVDVRGYPMQIKIVPDSGVGFVSIALFNSLSIPLEKGRTAKWLAENIFRYQQTGKLKRILLKGMKNVAIS